MKKILKKISILLVVIVMFTGAVPLSQVEGKSIAVSDTPQWILPFDAGQVWYICQGYYGGYSHSGNLSFALDLTMASNGMGSTACNPGTGAGNAGKNILAPVSGKAFKIATNMVEIRFSYYNNNRNFEKIQIGHMDYNANTWRYYTSAGINISQGTLLGTVASSGPNVNGYPHIHIHYVNIPIGTRFYNTPNLYNKGGSNQWSGQALCRSGVCVDTDDRLITNGQTLNGTINPANDTDTYTFNASAGQRATITMRKSSGNLDSYLTLLKPPDNSSLISDDDGGGNRDSLINNVSLPSSGTYKIITRSYNNSSAGGYTINLSITNPSINCPGQYKAEYYNNRSGSGNPTFIRCESWPISNNWGTGGPGNGVGNDNFFVRWTGQSNFSSGSYRFLARADDGIRVYFDNQQIINGWKDQSATDYSTTMSVNSGNHDVKIEYYENGGDAVAQFRWDANQNTTNLALRKSAYSGPSPVQSSLYGPYFANDGSMSSRWSSRDSGYQYWYTDLGSSQYFNQVVIRWEAAYAKKYAVVWSNDNNTWYWRGDYEYISSVGSYTHNIGNTYTARYIQIRMYEPAPQMGNYSMYEMEVYRR